MIAMLRGATCRVCVAANNLLEIWVLYSCTKNTLKFTVYSIQLLCHHANHDLSGGWTKSTCLQTVVSVKMVGHCDGYKSWFEINHSQLSCCIISSLAEQWFVLALWIFIKILKLIEFYHTSDAHQYHWTFRDNYSRISCCFLHSQFWQCVFCGHWLKVIIKFFFHFLSYFLICRGYV
jgi:hypothetical protein